MKELRALDILNEFKDKEDRCGRTPFTFSEYCEAIAELEALQEENEHLKRIVEAFKKENK